MTQAPTSKNHSLLKVGILAPLSWRVPPRAYGPWEEFVSLLTEGLVERNVAVTLFATGDSITKAKLSSVIEKGYSEDPGVDVKVAEGLHLAAFFERAGEFDLLHNSYDFLPLCFSRLVRTPMVTTIHGFSSERILPVYQEYDRENHYVSISDADRDPSLKYAATIHHGIDLTEFSVGRGERDYLLFFGRIHPDKGTREAILAARKAQMPILIAGIIQDKQYFEGAIAPLIDEVNVRYIGVVEKEKRAAVLGGARALLHLISFDEPFGFSVIEAMACGTPVIAMNRGSMGEVVIPGTNGLLVEHGEPVPVVERGQFDPDAVRQSVERHFSKDRMVDQYLALYHQILASQHPRLATV